MKVLELGSGAGDVSLLLTELNAADLADKLRKEGWKTMR
jgi:tRNA1(Val) A37 N6-methylase TrmN6